MLITLILTASIIFQIAAAFLALRLINITGRRMAWSFITAALILMAVRRVIPLYHLIMGNSPISPDLVNEIIGLILSMLMAGGIARIAPLFIELQHKEYSLLMSERRLNEAQRIAHIGNWELDLITNALSWSDEIFRMFEIDPKKFGASYEAFLDAIHPDDRETVNQAYTNSLKTKTPYFIDHRLKFPDGRIKYVHEQCETFYDPEGKPLRSVGTVQDITNRKLAEESFRQLNQRNRMILASAGEGIYGTDFEGNIVFINPAAAKTLGYEIEEVIGNNSHRLFHHTKADGSPYSLADCPLHQTLKRGGISRREDEIFWTKSGKSFAVEYINTPLIEAGKITGAVIIFRDITERKLAQEAIRLAYAYNRSLIEASLDPLVTINPDGKITDLNTATESITGRSREELIGTDFSDYFSQPERARDGYQHVFREGFVRDYALDIRHSKGYTTPVLYNASVYRDKEGHVIGVFAAARDITELRRAEGHIKDQYALLAAIMNSARDIIIFSIDKNYRYTTFNEKHHEEMKKVWDTDIKIGMNILDCMTIPELKELAKKSIDRALQGESFSEVQRQPEPDIYYEFNWNPVIQDQGITGATVFIRDITPQKKAEREIRKLNQELEQRVADRTARLETANKELEAFAYSVSHDLRTPLRHINGFVELLLENSKGHLDEEGLHFLDVITKSAHKMNTLIEDLLSFSRMGRNEMAFDNVDLGFLLKEVIREFEIEINGRNVHWHIADLPIVKGDRAMLQTVLTNLISNALKFSRLRPQTEIEIGCLPGTKMTGEESQTTLFIRDNGVGFDMKYSDQLFGVFHRLHREDEYEGTGIGLANVKRIITRHGGKVWADSEIGKGATFYFSLPIFQ